MSVNPVASRERHKVETGQIESRDFGCLFLFRKGFKNRVLLIAEHKNYHGQLLLRAAVQSAWIV